MNSPRWWEQRSGHLRASSSIVSVSLSSHCGGLCCFASWSTLYKPPGKRELQWRDCFHRIVCGAFSLSTIDVGGSISFVSRATCGQAVLGYTGRGSQGEQALEAVFPYGICFSSCLNFLPFPQWWAMIGTCKPLNAFAVVSRTATKSLSWTRSFMSLRKVYS